MRNRLVAIIDDDPAFAEWLDRRLSELGLETVVVNSGLEILSVLSIDRPGFVIIDMMLNWIDPAGLIDSFRRNPELRDIKIFLVTEQKPEENSRCPGSLPGGDIIYKPVDCDRLIDRLREEISDNDSA